MNEERSESGSALVVSLILVLLLVVLGAAVLSTSRIESTISHNDMWSEAAFQAAEAGVHVAIDQLTVDPAVSIQAIAETELFDGHRYRSGGRLDSGAQPLQFVGQQREAGYSIGLGTGYNPSGFTFSRYRINATGLNPRQARREIEVLARYGPIPE